MNIGDLTIFLKANVTDATKNIASFAESIEQTAKQAKRAFSEIGQAGTAVAAVATGALALASQHSGAAAQQLEGLERTSAALAVQVVGVLAPAIRAATQSVQGLANVVMTMSPETKAMIAHFVEAALAVAAFSKAFSLISGVVAGLSSVVSLLVGAAVPILGVVAALAAVAVAAVVLHKAWRENWGGMQEVVGELATAIREQLGSAFQFIKTLWDFQITTMQTGIDVLLQGIQGLLQAIGVAAQTLGEMLAKYGPDSSLGRAGQMLDLAKGLHGGSDTVGAVNSTLQDLSNKLKSSQLPDTLRQLGDRAKDAGGALVDEAKRMLKPVTDVIDDIINRYRGKSGVAGVGINPHNEILNTGAQVAALNNQAVLNAQTNLTGTGFMAAWETAGAAIGASAAQAETARGLVAEAQSHRLGIGTSVVGGIAGQSAPKMDGELGAVERGLNLLGEHFPRVASAARDLAEGLQTFARESLANIGTALGQAGQQLAGKLGNLGTSIQAGVSGGQAAGPWGAVIGVMLSFFEQAKAFNKVVSTANGAFAHMLDDLGPAFDGLASAVQRIMGALKPLQDGLHQIAGAIMDQVVRYLDDLAPILVELGQLFQVISPIFQMLASTLTPLKIVFQAVFYVLKVVAIVIGTIIVGLGNVWNTIIEALYELLQSIDQAFNTDTFKGAMEGLAQMKIDTGGASDALVNLEHQNYADANAAAAAAGADYEQAGAAQDAAKTLASFNEQLLNVPSGYKVGGARFGAQDPLAAGFSGEGTGYGSGSGITVNGDLHVTTASDEMSNSIVRKAKRQRFQRTGSSSGK